MLYFLAILALPYLSPVSLLLVEEPENGLHPARVAEVVRLLRAMVETTGTQVIIATHSPLVINELRPEEVTVVTRPSLEQGSQCTPIRETHNFAQRNGVYALGELWLADNFVATGPADLQMFMCERDGLYAIDRIRTTGPTPPAIPRSR